MKIINLEAPMPETYCECPLCKHMIPEEEIAYHLITGHSTIMEHIEEEIKILAKWLVQFKHVEPAHRGRPKLAHKKGFTQKVV